MGEADIRKLFQTTNQMQMLPEGGRFANTYALDDVQGYISMNSHNHLKTSMKSVKDRFMKAPYGFVEDDINWLVACLFKRGDISFTVNGASVSLNNKSEDEIINYITKKAFVEKLLMEERVRVAEKDKKAVRDVMKEVFNSTVSTEDEDSIMKDFKRLSSNMINEMDKLEVYYRQYNYPGKNVLDSGKRLLQSVMQLNGALEFFSHISKYQDTFFDMAEDYEPVKAFFNGEQQNIFMRALDMLAIYEDSKTYIVDSELEKVVGEMRAIVKQDKPYKNIPKLPELIARFRDAYNQVIDVEEAPVLNSIDQSRQRVLEVLSTKEYEKQKKEHYLSLFEEIKDGAQSCNNISSLRSFADKAGALKIRLMDEMDDMDRQIAERKQAEEIRRIEEEAKKLGSAVSDVEVARSIAEQKKQYKVRKTKNVPIKKITGTSSWRLENKADIDKYVEELRMRLLSQMDEDTIVNIEF